MGSLSGSSLGDAAEVNAVLDQAKRTNEIMTVGILGVLLGTGIAAAVYMFVTDRQDRRRMEEQDRAWRARNLK
jgi:hypothetical protein